MAAKNIQFTKTELTILKHIFRHFRDKTNARQLARRLSLNHAHVNKLCNSLAAKMLLNKEEMGNSIYYSFNYDSELGMDFMVYLLSLEDFPKWLSVLAHELKRFNGHIEMGLVFGSSIRSDKYNDIDVLLMHKNPAEITRVKDSIRKAGLLEKPIRYVEISPADITKNKSSDAFYGMLSDSLIFYNARKYAEVIRCLR